MLRSMFTAIGGLRNHQVMLDVTANNIANVNTVGYKAQRVNFESMMAQTLRRRQRRPWRTASAAPARPRSASAWRSTPSGSLLTQGSLQTTGQWSDLGDLTATATSPSPQEVTTSGNGALPAAPDIAFTRAGNFTIDKAGWLVDQLRPLRPGPARRTARARLLPNELRAHQVSTRTRSPSRSTRTAS